MTIDQATGLVQWTPSNDQVGSAPASVRVEDLLGLFDVQSFTIDVAGADDPPQLITAATVGELYLNDLDVIDTDLGNVHVFSLPQAPAGMTIDPVTGLVEWVPTDQQVGPNISHPRVSCSR